MREPDIEKEQKLQPGKFTGQYDTKSNARERRAPRIRIIFRSTSRN